MKSERFISGSFVLLILACCLLLTGCGAAERSRTSITCRKFNVEVELPKPFSPSKVQRDLGRGYTMWETGYTAEDFAMQLKVMELTTGQMENLGLNRRGLFNLAKDQEVGALKIVEQKDVDEPGWPERISNATDYALDSADGKTRTYVRALVYTGPDFTRCSIVLKALAPKSDTRPLAVEQFFNSLKITEADASRLGPEFKYPIQ